jgi:DNA ligase (NAD+)
MAADLARNYPDLASLSQSMQEELQQIEGIGPNIAEAIVDWFARPANQTVLSKLRSVGVWPKSDTSTAIPKTKQTLGGMTFVITGTLPEFSREEAKEFIESFGGKVTDSVSKKTSYLVLGSDPGSKYEKALALGIPIIDEAGLRKLA